MRFELVFIPFPGIGHLKSTVETAKLLVERDDRISVSVLILPYLSEDGSSAYVASLSAAHNNRLRYEVISGEDEQTTTRLDIHIKNQIPKVRHVLEKLVSDYSTLPDSPRLAGVVVDLFCTVMIDVANKLGIPSYLFYTSSAGLIGLGFHVQLLYDEEKYNVHESDYEESEAVLDVPSLKRPLPVKCLPQGLASKEWLPILVNQAKKYRQMKGILLNTVSELEPYTLKSLSSGGDIPPVYPIGPILQLENQTGGDNSDVLEWLDEQPLRSVVFLCFGSMGSFCEEQAREIAVALERSGHRFLWSLRRKSKADQSPEEIKNLDDILPLGFIDRTKNKGKVIGWAPQTAVLAKPAIGGFITHCGWNSVLESIWFGVPMAAWPLYAEQKFNAFEVVEELGLAVEIKKYWRSVELVTSEEIEKAIKCLMEQDSHVRKRIKEMSENCHIALMDGGSSQTALQMFIHDVIQNIIA